ncbi:MULTISPECIES: hypothetical protein [unclassified Streptomyces]|uniref:hypothetical protein n=1 Tax=unclassified Streptomyces TaxID=2593676 RepID=UPI002E1235BB|nr:MULTISPECIES: hypothetical protein [unclassified Streptomyces]WSQ81409.1 hypothetical protein OG725_31815 [Streptomyces sp. NBC_01213]WSQ88736.1 hypothetical protein OG722_32215 [Streptomyces sp. NBC_01212]WSR05259.1 hypothetical protein OG265_04290 [Streptomyces sp. NBC_01208]WSR52131.1 hypothetical protein OG279_32810 [Streptomyces sp. NBC_01201]
MSRRVLVSPLLGVVLALTSRRMRIHGGQGRRCTKDFTDKGDISVGCVDAEGLARVRGELPACDSTLLHGSGARTPRGDEGPPPD